MIEHWAADLLTETGVGARMQREGLIHDGVHFSVGGELHFIDFRKLVGKGIVVYGQHEVVKDLIAQRLADGGQILFDVDEVSVHAIDTTRPVIRFGHERGDAGTRLRFHRRLRRLSRHLPPEHPGARRRNPTTATIRSAGSAFWRKRRPSPKELIYAYHSRGFALFSMRSPSIVRYYLQCAPDEDIEKWSDRRIWDELQIRLGPADGRTLAEGKVLQKSVTAMRSFVVEPMQYRPALSRRRCRPYRAADRRQGDEPRARRRALALSRASRNSTAAAPPSRSIAIRTKCLPRVWKAQRFSWWMTQMLHRFTLDDDFDHHRQMAEIDYVARSEAAAQSLAENYVGLPIE